MIQPNHETDDPCEAARRAPMFPIEAHCPILNCEECDGWPPQKVWITGTSDGKLCILHQKDDER